MAGQRRVSPAPRVLITAALEQIRFVCNSHKTIFECFSSISNCVCTSGVRQRGGGGPLPRLPLCRGQHLWDKRRGRKIMTLKLMQPWLMKKYFEKLMTTCCLLKTQLPCTIMILVLFKVMPAQWEFQVGPKNFCKIRLETGHTTISNEFSKKF